MTILGFGKYNLQFKSFPLNNTLFIVFVTRNKYTTSNLCFIFLWIAKLKCYEINILVRTAKLKCLEIHNFA